MRRYRKNSDKAEENNQKADEGFPRNILPNTDFATKENPDLFKTNKSLGYFTVMQGVNKIGFITIWQWWAAVSKNGWTFGTCAMFIPALFYFTQWNPYDFYKTQGRKCFFATYTFFYSLALMTEYVLARGILIYKLA